MATPYLGEIKMGGWNFAPVGWAKCDGTLLPIDQNSALFQLIGNAYGGDGQRTFGLPDLQSRIPVHVGPGFTLTQRAGFEAVTLTSNQVPPHGHTFSATANAGNQTAPPSYVPAALPSGNAYIQGAPTTALASGSLQGGTGGNQPHDNIQPSLCVMFVIALFGIFPTQN